MACIIPDTCKIIYLNTLDRVQAFDIFEHGDDYNEFMDDIRRDVRNLHRFVCVEGETGILRRLNVINSKLDARFDTYDHLLRSDIREFIHNRTSIDVSETMESMCNCQYKLTTYIIDAMNSIKQRSATEPDLTEEHVSNTIPEQTVSGKLMKKHICSVCRNTFETNRKDAQYCSPKCKQAAYRERREKNTTDTM